MEKNFQITDEEWEKLKDSSFPLQRFLEDIELFYSIRHCAGASSFSEDVLSDLNKVKDLAGKVFSDGRRDCVGELFFEGACINELMIDLEDWILSIRKAFRSLNKLRPISVDLREGGRMDTSDLYDDDTYGSEAFAAHDSNV
jgi:hypothetical protein